MTATGFLKGWSERAQQSLGSGGDLGESGGDLQGQSLYAALANLLLLAAGAGDMTTRDMLRLSHV